MKILSSVFNTDHIMICIKWILDLVTPPPVCRWVRVKVTVTTKTLLIDVEWGG